MKQAALEIPARRPDTAPGLAAPRDAIALALRPGERAVRLTAEECELVQDMFMRAHLRRTLKIPGRRKGDLRIPDRLDERLNSSQISRFCAWNWWKRSA
jgi:hypothetical protein